MPKTPTKGKKGAAPEPLLHGFDQAPDHYVTGYKGISLRGGVVTVNYYREFINTGTNRTERKVSHFMTASLPDFLSMYTHTGKFLEELRKQGVIVADEEVKEEK